MKIATFPAGYIGTNAYLLTDESRGEAILIDAPHDVSGQVDAVLEREKCRLVALLVTHGHWDHTGDAGKFQNRGVPVYAHAKDRALLETPEVMKPLLPPEIHMDPVKIDHEVRDGEMLELAGQTIEVREVPGHCPGNVLFYFIGLKAAFVGDALFAGSVGRTDLPGGDFLELERSIQSRIYTLPDDTLVYPGHGPETTVSHEAHSNPFVTRV